MCLSWRVKKANKLEKPHTQVQQTCFITSKGNCKPPAPGWGEPKTNSRVSGKCNRTYTYYLNSKERRNNECQEKRHEAIKLGLVNATAEQESW